MNRKLSLAGRILFGVPLLIFGAMHLGKSDLMAGRVLTDWPMAQVLVIVSGLGLVAAALAVLSGRMMKLAGTLLAVELLIFVFTIHIPHVVHATDEMMKTQSMVQIFKDTMLAGAALLIASLERPGAAA